MEERFRTGDPGYPENRTPLVSIGMPVYNDVKFIEKAINSLLSQTFTDFEFIISDDCSTDGSETICRQYAALDTRIKYTRQVKNIGISKNMEFLIQNATGKYFMWAGNDDIWHPEFIQTLVEGFKDDNVVSVFCPMYFIDESDKMLTQYGMPANDYSGSTPYVRLKKLIRIFDDAFGYGLFLREKIVDIKFPVWWWVNKNCAYNNIYPTLCYYLAKGDFRLVGNRPLWFNRLKEEKNINHKIPYNTTFIRSFSAYALRRFNLAVVSLQNIARARSIWLSFRILPRMLYSWFLIPTIGEFKTRYISYRKGTVSFW